MEAVKPVGYCSGDVTIPTFVCFVCLGLKQIYHDQIDTFLLFLYCLEKVNPLGKCRPDRNRCLLH